MLRLAAGLERLTTIYVLTGDINLNFCGIIHSSSISMIFSSFGALGLLHQDQDISLSFFFQGGPCFPHNYI